MVQSWSQYICNFCGHSIGVSEDQSMQVLCDRCGHMNHRYRVSSAKLSLVFSITSLIFYIPANLLPFMTVEFYGSRNRSTIWEGIVSLAEGGSWTIAIIVFLASMLIPFIKLVILFYLGLSAGNHRLPRFKTRLYHFVETIGRWSMLDIFLLAVLVAIMKLGVWTKVTPEPGSLMFAFVVIFTMLASKYFDPRILWEGEHE